MDVENSQVNSHILLLMYFVKVYQWIVVKFMIGKWLFIWFIIESTCGDCVAIHKTQRLWSEQWNERKNHGIYILCHQYTNRRFTPKSKTSSENIVEKLILRLLSVLCTSKAIWSRIMRDRIEHCISMLKNIQFYTPKINKKPIELKFIFQCLFSFPKNWCLRMMTAVQC